MSSRRMQSSSTSSAINDSSKADSVTTAYRVTRNMVYPIATNVRYQSSRAQPEVSSSIHGGERSSSTRSSSLCSSAASSSDQSCSPSSSSSSSPISPLTYRTSATAPLSQSNHPDTSVPSLSSYQAPLHPSTTAILPLYRYTTYTTSRRNVPQLPVNACSQANPVTPPASYGFPNSNQSGFPQPSYQNEIDSPIDRPRTDPEQLLTNHDLPRSLPPLPNLQTSNHLSALQHTYMSMLAKNPSHGSSMDATPKTANSPAAATAATHGAAPAKTALDALFEPGVSRSHADSCDDDEIDRVLTDLVDLAFPSSPPSSSIFDDDYSPPASSQAQSTSDEHSVATEPLTFDSLFNVASQSTGTAPPTPYVHDASAFTSMHNSLPSTTIFADLAAKFGYDNDADQAVFPSSAQSTPPSASEPPALSFSPTSPFEAVLSATPGTGLSLMDVDPLDGEYDGMPLFAFEDGHILPLFYGDDTSRSAVSPSALGLKGVAPPPLFSAPIQVSTDPAAQPMNELDGLIAMIDTPSVVPIPLSTTLTTAPLPSPSSSPGDASSSSAPATTQKPVGRPTGHRKNLSPSSLLPVNAPTQPRSYRGPSATSRKDIPAFAFASSSRRAVTSKKRKAEADPEDLDGDDDNDEEEMTTGRIKPRMGESEIEAKRRQNTLAARRSRHRKLQYVRELEEKVEALMKQNIEMAERLRSAGLEP